MTLHNLNVLPLEAIEGYGAGAATKLLGKLAGSQKLCIGVDVLPPGAYSAKFHAHSTQEEFFIILAGHGTLRTAQGEQPVKAGDFFSKPAGFSNPHTFYNSSDAPLEILDISTVEPADVAHYPDEDVYFLRGAGGGKVLLGGSGPKGWTSDPDEISHE